MLRMDRICLFRVVPKEMEIGKKFGRWTIIKRAGSSPDRNVLWECVCDCGTRRAVIARSLRSGKSTSCGCFQKERLSQLFSRPLKDRFWEKVEITETCWLWRGAIDEETGYGKLGISAHKIEGAHRIAYKIFNGQIPSGLDVCHRCNIRQCVNPDHLYAGTRKQNMEQAVRDGRLGRKNASSKSQVMGNDN